MRDFADRGADVMRINCAHDDQAAWAAMIANVRSVAAEIGRPLRVMMDIAGPKVRTGRVLTPPDRSHIHVGDMLLLAREIGPASAGVPFQVTCTEPRVFAALKVGERGFHRRRAARRHHRRRGRRAASSSASSAASSPA